jgi:predicted nuclease with TOPRIM domain
MFGYPGNPPFFYISNAIRQCPQEIQDHFETFMKEYREIRKEHTLMSVQLQELEKHVTELEEANGNLRDELDHVEDERNYYRQRNIELDSEVAYQRHELQKLPQILNHLLAEEVQRIFNA